MALTDCEKCWSTPCECGYEYRNWSEEHLSKFIASIISYKPLYVQSRILKNASLQMTFKYPDKED